MSEAALDIATPSGKDKSTENFPVGSALIRPDLRPHVHAYYRWARMADDIADNPALAPEDKVARLDLMEAALKDPARRDVPVAADMRESLRATNVPEVDCTDLLIAFRWDATKLRYDDWADLMTYCRYSASPVGRYLLDVHGEDPDGKHYSDGLCDALQVINHLQDCKADYLELNRVYVPVDHLAAEGIGLEALAEPRASPALRRVLDRLLDETDALMVRARKLPAALRDTRLRCESATIVRLADTLIAQLRRRDPLAERVKLARPAVAWCAIQGVAWALATPKPKRVS
ncbi:MAG TPA: squalene synthase HpnC [Dongiaceae bacterium]|nr:squalene synthase HpnC [Dongiaceae bacterium]